MYFLTFCRLIFPPHPIRSTILEVNELFGAEFCAAIYL